MNILIADDDPFIADRYAAALRAAGHGVTTCPDGGQALAEITAGGYDLALLDVILPAKDGFQILGTLQRRGWARPAVILLTNLGRREDVERGIALGARDYLIKARSSPQELVAKVEAVMESQLTT